MKKRSSQVKPVSFQAVAGEGPWLDNEHILYIGGIVYII